MSIGNLCALAEYRFARLTSNADAFAATARSGVEYFVHPCMLFTRLAHASRLKFGLFAPTAPKSSPYSAWTDSL